jgi:hypothetical protein
MGHTDTVHKFKLWDKTRPRGARQALRAREGPRGSEWVGHAGGPTGAVLEYDGHTSDQKVDGSNSRAGA